jgi:peroxiredoxin
LFTVNAYAAPAVKSPLRRAFSGSSTGDIQETQETLDFNADQINVRDRLVIDIPTIDAPVCSTTDTTGPVT